MNIQLHILNTNGRMAQYKNDLERISYETINKVIKLIPVNNIDLIFYDSGGSNRTIKHLGFAGYSVTKNLIMVAINPDFADLRKSLDLNLSRTIAHELYHCVRNYTFSKKHTLLEALIDEGLADHFALEVIGGSPEKWDTALNKDKLIVFMERAKKEFNNLKYDRKKWFFGSEENKIPKWTGYTLGFNLVERYLKKNKSKKPSDLYNQEAESFLYYQS